MFRQLPARPAVLRGRLPGVVTAALGVALLGAAVVSMLSVGRQAALADLDHALTSEAVSNASSLKEYFDRAQSIDLLLAHDSAFQQFEPGRGLLSGPQVTAASAQAGEAMAYLERLYPGRISEACLIDSTGTELARVVRGKVAPASEMSTEEARNPFFAPTLRLPRGRVYQAAPYKSDDTHQWVISNSTPMVSAGGRAWGLVHFEVALSSFLPDTDGEDRRGFSARIVDARTGRVLLDTGRRQARGAVPGRDGSPGLRALVARSAAVASATVDGQRMAVARVPVQQHNANSWTVVVTAPTRAVGWSRSIGSEQVATGLAALLLLVLAGLNLRASRQTERQSEARYRALIDQSSDLVMVTDRTGHARFLSPSAERLLASPGDDLPGARSPANVGPVDLLAAVDPQDRAQLSAALLAAGPGHPSAVEIRITGTDGVRTFDVSVQDLTTDRSVGGLVLTAHDVTDPLALQREMEHRALHDSLTGLPNRALLADRFDQALRSAQRDGTSTGLLLIDLDRFKDINDTFGHHYGDELLIQVGPRLAGVLREVDTVARLGGDEFAVLLPDVHSVADATAVGTKLRAALERPFRVEGVDLDVEASVGVVLSGEHGQDATTLLQRADIAMYVAKSQNLGVFAYDPAVDAHSPAKLALLGDLRRALERGELVLHYQPKISISTGEVVGAEALVRWQHPERGLVMPDAFIPLAEHTGLIGPLTRYVLDAALGQARAWSDAGRPLPVSVNLSARNLLDERLPGQVAELLAKHGVDAGLLELEVTESAIMTEPVRAQQLMERLSALGVHISIDDFGAGYTSLGQLTSLPVNELKIDRSFVTTMADDPSNALIVHSVVDLSHNLGLTTVAEGVETADALAALASFGCDVAQGYHLSRPLPADAFDTWWTERRLTPGPPAVPAPTGPVPGLPTLAPTVR